MNKIFKVVWSKVRNSYVVVSEVAKANGKTSVKARVGRASLAATMAVTFMLSGGMMSTEAATYVEAQGSKIIVAQNTQDPVKDYKTGNGERVVGGWNSMSGVTATTLNSNITVTGGEYNMIVGGNYTGNSHNMTVESTTVTIDGATVKQFIGGTGFNGVDGADNAANRTTNVTINSGYFGAAVDNTNVPEKHVVAGDLLKTGATNQTATSTIADTQLTINDGTFDAAVYGGSAAIRYYAGYTSGEVKATVENAQIDITGGTFNEAIVAGGLASGHETDSIVKNAQVNISGVNGGLDINGDIFAGGMDGSLGAGFETAISKVEKATVNIDNATVNNVYGSGGNIISKQNGSAYSWEYKQNTDADAVVDTDLTLDNVTANTVDIQKGSITLKGENTVASINAGADAAIMMDGTAGTLNAQIVAGTIDLGNGNVWNVTEDSNVTAVTGTNYEIAGTGEQNLVVNNTNEAVDTDSNGIYSSDTAKISGLNNLEVNSANRHAIEVGTDMTIEANGVKLNAVNGNGAMVYGDLTVKADDMAIHAQNGHGIRAAADDGHAANVNIDVDRLTVVADNTQETAIKVSDGASVNVNAADTANINGQILAEVDSTVALSGGTVNVTSVEDALDAVGGTITVDAENVNLTSADSDGIQAYDATITVNGDNVVVQGKSYGVKSIADTESKVEITGTDVTIEGTEGAIGAFNSYLVTGVSGKSEVAVKAEGTVDIKGEVYGELDSKISLEGETVNVAGGEKDALDSFGGTIDVKADNINITSATNDGIQADDATVTLKGGNVTVAGGTWGIKNIDETNSNVVVDGTNVTITGAEDNAIWAMGSGDGKVTVNATDTANINGQVYVEIDSEVALSGGTVNVTSVEDALDTFGGTITVEANDINITSTNKDGIQADDATVTLKGDNVTVEGGAWGIKNIDETNSNVVVDGTNVTIKGGTDADEGAIWAMGAGDGEVTVTATETVDIQGEVNVDIGAAVTLKGETVNVAGGEEDALDACGGTIDIEADNINITSDINDAIQANDGDITLTSDAKDGGITITSGSDNDNWAIKNLDETDSDVTINAAGDVTIKGTAGAIMTSENGQGSVTVNGEGTTTIEGNIEAASKGNVSVLLNTADSLLDGDVKTTNGKTTITMNNGATWEVDNASNVSEIAGNQGTIAVEKAQKDLVTIDKNTNDNLKLNVADGGDVGVDVKAGIQALKETVNIKDGNKDIDLGVDEIALKAAVDEVDGEVTTTIKPGDNFVIESDVQVTGDVVAGDVSLKETAEQVALNDRVNQVQNTQIAKLQSDNLAQDRAIAENKAAIGAEAAAREAADAVLQGQIDTNATAIADEVKAREAADAVLQGQIDTNATAIADEVKARTDADTALQGQIDTNVAGIADNKQAITGLNSRLSSLDGRVDKVGAGAAALAALHPLDYDPEDKLSFAAGVGNYAGETAAAVGAFYRPNEDVMLSIGGTAGNGENMVNMGVSFALGKGASGVAKMSKAELVQEVTNMKAENEELKQENKDIRNELNKLKELVMKLAEEK